uniref:BLTX228 n=1 Tax=Nephila pilipes TaxID=299642 RepID=A0A076KZ59_NEPPI|nr:BLTX228 [Nephila pilipes]
MHRLFAVSCILILILGLPGLNGYTFSEYLNTENGFCESEGSERIPVGETGYNDKTCERIQCSTGFRHVVGCGKVMKPDDPRCRIVQREGRYPNCCPDIECNFDQEQQDPNNGVNEDAAARE